jgi:hypothetical protein
MEMVICLGTRRRFGRLDWEYSKKLFIVAEETSIFIVFSGDRLPLLGHSNRGGTPSDSCERHKTETSSYCLAASYGAVGSGMMVKGENADFRNSLSAFLLCS